MTATTYHRNESRIYDMDCHNCRRQRLKCDRSSPQCLKCLKRGQECLGYQRLLRWTQGATNRGKVTGVKSHDVARPHLPQSAIALVRQHHSPRSMATLSPPMILTDPLIQDLDHASRKYLIYCELPLSCASTSPLDADQGYCLSVASNVCKDFVVYDTPEHNPFRELIPMTHDHPLLLQIIIANSALHMSNTCQDPLSSPTTPSLSPSQTGPLSSADSTRPVAQRLKSHNDALVAKQRALCLLRSTLTTIASANIEVTLAVVLLFIEFELIDCGRDSWRHHVHAARAIIKALFEHNTPRQGMMSPLRSCLVSHCLVYVHQLTARYGLAMH